jgi:hypothetical protein
VWVIFLEASKKITVVYAIENCCKACHSHLFIEVGVTSAQYFLQGDDKLA